jgi:hypothetical protein
MQGVAYDRTKSTWNSSCNKINPKTITDEGNMLEYYLKEKTH